LSAACRLDFQIEDEIPLILMLRPRSGDRQWVVRESYVLEPYVRAFEYTDIFGNLCQRLVAPRGNFSILTTCEVMVRDDLSSPAGGEFISIPKLPEATLAYLLPSRYCESDRFGALAREIITTNASGYEQAASICRWVQRNIQYCPGSSNLPVSAVEVNARQFGVCRDLAHLGIALCRSISLPARFVAGYLYGLQPMDLHAWFEIFVGDCWYPFDPTQYMDRGRRIAIAYGRDAADVSIFHQFGAGDILLNMDVRVELFDRLLQGQ
jgi:transglutaminase-like putative cysteine protease